MLASVRAACHHLGQPATVLAANMELIRRLTTDLQRPELQEVVELSRLAIQQVSTILLKLNRVSEFKTVPYLEQHGQASPDNTILEI